MVYRVLFLTIALFIGISGTSFSQIRLPDVTGPIVQKLPVFIPDLSSVGPSNPKGREFVEVLRNDLQNAALFDVSSGGATIGNHNNINFQAIFDAGVDYLIAGQYQTVGNKIKFAVQLYNVKEERPILGRSYVATPGRVREAAHKFADLAMKQITGKEGFFTAKIAFVLGSRSKRNLFLMDYDGFNKRQLTRHNSLLMSPDCSPDGRQIIFNSDKVWDQDLYIITLGSKIKERRLTRAFKLEQSAEWSPSGKQLAFSANGDIYVSGISGKGARNLTRSHSIDVSPAWSPDGSKIAFVSDRSGNPQIYVMNSNGSGLRRITSSGYNTDPSWSPNRDVNKIAFVRVEGGANIYTIDPSGGGEQRLTFSGGRNENPAWSPDGYYIAFSSSRAGAKDIYLMYVNGENQVRLSQGGGKTFPTWCK
ncbi:MAG: Tol-Pal system beta propeller repeat protein TolB [Candidatus Dadabacteria bacterium]|nr:MAG: Tol-Pal system beta propeller repeat protein TolB [Candidatus Dadabacteria bacterium]